MKLSSIFCLLCATLATASANLNPVAEYGEQAPLAASSLGNCTASNLPTYDLSEGDVPFETDLSINVDSPRYSTLNASTWDYWLFYAVSAAGDAGFCMSVFRDGSGPGRGGTNFRFMMEIRFHDGTTFTGADFHQHSTVEVCDDGRLRGVWSTEDETGATSSISFETVGNDMRQARVTIDMPKVKGTLSFRTRTKPVFANGANFPSAAADAFLAPGMWWITPMAGADVEAEVVVEGNRELFFTGRGGHDRIWSTLAWPQLARSWVFIRTTIGPYALNLCEVVSASDGGTRHQAVSLQKDGDVVFASRNTHLSLDEDHAILRQTFDGNLKGKWHDASTGYVLDLVSPAKRKHWRFSLKHEGSWWSAPTGRTGTGNVGFIDAVNGGEVHGEQHVDYGLSSSIEFP